MAFYYPNHVYQFSESFVKCVNGSVVPEFSKIEINNINLTTKSGNKLSELIDIKDIVDNIIARELTLVVRQQNMLTGFAEEGALQGLEFNLVNKIKPSTFRLEPNQAVTIPKTAYSTFDNCLLFIISIKIHTWPSSQDTIFSMQCPQFENIVIKLNSDHTLTLDCINRYELLYNPEKEVQNLCLFLSNNHSLATSLFVCMNETLIAQDLLKSYDKKLGFATPITFSSSASSWSLQNFSIYTGQNFIKDKFVDICDFQRLWYLPSSLINLARNVIKYEASGDDQEVKYPIPFGERSSIEQRNKLLYCDLGVGISWYKIKLEIGNIFETSSVFELYSNVSEFTLKIGRLYDHLFLRYADSIIEIDYDASSSNHIFEIEVSFIMKQIKIFYSTAAGGPRGKLSIMELPEVQKPPNIDFLIGDRFRDVYLKGIYFYF